MSTQFNRLFAVIAVLALATLASCGGGGGQSGPGGMPASAAANVTFPAHGAIVIDSQMSVCGTTPNGADSVTVAGVSATSSDGFRNWRVDLTLQDGLNDLDIEVVQAGVMQTPVSHQLRLDPQLELSLDAAALGQDGSLVYFSRGETGSYTLTRLQANGVRNYHPSVSTTSVPPSGRVAYDSTQNLLTLSVGFQSLVVFNLQNGQLLGPYNFPGNFSRPSSLITELSTGEVFVAAVTLSAPNELSVFRFRPQIGDFSQISGPFPAASAFGPQFLTHDPINNLLYAWDEQEKSIYRFDVVSGVRDLLAANMTILGAVRGLAVDPMQSRIEVVNQAGERYAVATGSGAATLLPRLSCDPGYVNVPPSGVAPQPAYKGIIGDGQGTVYIMRNDRIVKSNPDGSCAEIIRVGRGPLAGMAPGSFRHLAWDSLRQRVVGTGLSELFAVEPATGNLEQLAKPVIGYIHAFERPIRYDASADRLYYISAAANTGPGGVFSTPALGGEETFEVPLPMGYAAQNVDYDPVAGEYLVVTESTLGPPASFTVRRIKDDGSTLAEHSLSPSPVVATKLLPHAASQSVFGFSLNPMELVRLTLPTFALTSVAHFSASTNASVTYFYDPTRDELLTLLDNVLTINEVDTGATRSSTVLTGLYSQPSFMRGLTRDLETGIIYIGGDNGRLLMIDPVDFSRAFVHY